MADLIDDQDFGGAFGWPKLEAELFLENGKQRWFSGVGSFLGGPLDLKVEVAVEAGVVLDRTASLWGAGSCCRRSCLPSSSCEVVVIEGDSPLDKQQLAVFAVFGTGAWVAWLIFSAVRQYLLARAQAVAQDKLLLHVSSSERLQTFLTSDSGIQFLRSLERSPSDAWPGIIRSCQTAAMFLILGVGALICRACLPETQGLLPFTLAAFILAAAFAASAAVSFGLHRRAGLLRNGRG